MRIVITGATGNVGTALIDALVSDDRDDEIIGLARRMPQWTPPRTELRSVDIARDDLTPHLAGAHAVVHLAWLFQPTHQPLVTWDVNVIGSQRVFEAAARAGLATLIHASSVGSYSARVDDHPVDESWPTHSLPTAAYGREKAYGGEAANLVADILSGAHPLVNFSGTRFEDSCPLDADESNR